jgi:hypothetical protein
MREELEEITRKLVSGDLDIPPEGERSPSPEPVYGPNGIRLNTRDIRAREKLIEARQRSEGSVCLNSTPHYLLRMEIADCSLTFVAIPFLTFPLSG